MNAVAGHLPGEHPASTHVLLTGLTPDGEQLLVIPLYTAMDELQTLSVLLNAATFEEAKRDADAAQLVDDQVPIYLQALQTAGRVDDELDEDTLVIEHTWSGAPFDVEDFFGGDASWRPDARLSTAQWLATEEPDLLQLCALSPPAEGIARVPATSRAPLERLLTRLGYRVRRSQGLCAAYEDPHAFLHQLARADQPSTDSVVLTAVSIDGQQVLAVPREVAAAELRTAALLAKASTFGEVRQDADAAAVVEQYMDEYRQRLLDQADWPEEDDEEVLARLTGDTGDYHAPHFFSDDDQLEWQAYAEVRASTAGWLAQSEPALLERYGRYDEGDGPMYEKATWIAAADRDAFEGGLLAAGYTVQHVDTLHQLYLDPPLDVENALDHGESR